MIDWSVAIAVFLAILAASLAERWLVKQRAGSSSEILAIHTNPWTASELVKAQYPTARSVDD